MTDKLPIETLEDDARAFELYSVPPFLQVAGQRADFVARLRLAARERDSLTAQLATTVEECAKAVQEHWRSDPSMSSWCRDRILHAIRSLQHAEQK